MHVLIEKIYLLQYSQFRGLRKRWGGWAAGKLCQVPFLNGHLCLLSAKCVLTQIILTSYHGNRI